MGVYNDRDLTRATQDVDAACGALEVAGYAAGYDKGLHLCDNCQRPTSWHLKIDYVRGSR